LTNCTNQHDTKSLNTGVFETKKIEAELSYSKDMNMKDICFKIDDLLYSLSIIDIENDYKIVNLHCKDANNALLYNGPDLYWIRAEFFNGDIIRTETLYNDNGFTAEYIISKDSLSYGKIGYELTPKR
jgi:hypothetical protein